MEEKEDKGYTNVLGKKVGGIFNAVRKNEGVQ